MAEQPMPCDAKSKHDTPGTGNQTVLPEQLFKASKQVVEICVEDENAAVMSWFLQGLGPGRHKKSNARKLLHKKHQKLDCPS